jgi:hypothetical protein
MKVKHCTKQDGKHYGWSFVCPGCDQHHVIPTEGGHERVNWQFNGDIERPTFTPSLRVVTKKECVCHSVITDGRIQFCGDCTHALVGKTVELLNIPNVV